MKNETWSKFHNGKKATAEQILDSKVRNKSNTTVRSQVGKLTVWTRLLEIENL